MIVGANICFFITATRVTGYRVKIFQNISGKGIVLAIGCGIFFYLVLDRFLDPIFDNMFSSSAANYEDLIATLRTDPIMALVRVCLIAPITEELLMRGYIMTGLRNDRGVVKHF